jgi:ADP-heptose:LPS heptosyltransferase
LNKAQYRLIIRLLLEKTAWIVLLTGALGAENFVHELAMDFPHERIKETVGRFSLAELFPVILNSSLLIPGSACPLHIAITVRVPLIGFSVQ